MSLSFNPRPGLRHDQRLLPPLRRGAVPLRPTSLSARFLDAAEHLGLHPRRSILDQPIAEPTPWGALFEDEPAYTYARLIEWDRAALERAFHEAKNTRLRNVQQALAFGVEQMLDWHTRLQRWGMAADLDTTRLQPFLNQRGQSLSQTILGAEPVLNLAGARQLVRAYDACLMQLADQIERWRSAATAAFGSRLNSGLIDPALGLIIAELGAVSQVDAHLNTLTERHTDFLYRGILGQSPAPAEAAERLFTARVGEQSVYLPQGQGLSATDETGETKVFRVLASSTLRPVRIQSAHTLAYPADPLSSLTTAFGAITRVVAARSDLDVPDSPLFFGSQEYAASLGFDLAAPILNMKEGTRKIKLELHLTRASALPAHPADAQQGRSQAVNPDLRLELDRDTELCQAFGLDAQGIEELILTLSQAEVQPSLFSLYAHLSHQPQNGQSLSILLRRWVSLCLIENAPLPTGDLAAKLLSQVEANGLSNNSALEAFVLSLKFGEKLRADAFTRYFGQAFEVRAATTEGLIPPKSMEIRPLESGAGLTIDLSFSPQQPALTACEYDNAHLAVRLNPKALRCPLSFFDGLKLQRADISVDVDQIRGLIGFSDDAQIALDQVSLPFGAQPREGSSLMVGTPELAEKAVTHLGLHITWHDLPTVEGGFDAHYKGYEASLPRPDPKLQLDYLSADGWKSLTAAPVALAETDVLTRRLTPKFEFFGAIEGQALAAPGPVEAQEFSARNTIRAGMVRLTLHETGDHFLSDAYPKALMRAMTPPRSPVKLPGQQPTHMPERPVVPKIANLTLGYRATATILPGVQQGPARLTQRSALGADPVTGPFPLFPERLGSAALYVQLDGAGPTSLFFELSDQARRQSKALPPVKWLSFDVSGWRAVRVIHDTTAGLRRTGLVNLDIPMGSTWIAAVADGAHIDAFPHLKALHTNAFLARQEGEASAGSFQSWNFDPPIPGLGAVTPLTAVSEAKTGETIPAFYTRVSERLSHRNRALRAQDVERLVVQHFHDVWRVVCLPDLGTVAVVGHSIEHRLFDQERLKTIRAFLDARCPPFMSFNVINARYDYLYVRGHCLLAPGMSQPIVAERVQGLLNRWLTPWSAGSGERAMDRFGWRLETRALHQALAGLPGITALHDFSVLSLSQKQDLYTLDDTARKPGVRAPLAASGPFSLPLSAPSHGLTYEGAQGRKPQLERRAKISGIGRLAVGGMLIVDEQRTQP